MPKAVVFWDESFPFIDTCPLGRDAFEGVLAEGSVQFAGAPMLADALAADPDVFVNPYGSAFPKPCWTAFLEYLRRGGSWVNLGGAPLSRPVRLQNGRWKPECQQANYGKALGLNHAFPVEMDGLQWRWTKDLTSGPLGAINLTPGSSPQSGEGSATGLSSVPSPRGGEGGTAAQPPDGVRFIERIPGYVYELARTFRAGQTPPEMVLWELLRDRRLDGCKFRRQHPLGRYIADFYCAESGVVVEVDGIHHLGEEQAEYDHIRDEALRNRGLRVLRIPARLLSGGLEDLEQVFTLIRTSLTPGPSPQSGEGSATGLSSVPSPRGGEGGTAAQPPDGVRFALSRAWSLQVRFTDNLDLPAEDGSAGTRLAVMRTLLSGERDGRRLAAPVVAIDRLMGDGDGGRWVLVNADLSLPLPKDLLGSLLRHAAQGVVQLAVRPSFACYTPGERPACEVSVRASRLRADSVLRVSLRAPVGAEDAEVRHLRLRPGPDTWRHCVADLPADGPGLYLLRATLSDARSGEILARHETGFWVQDEVLLASGSPLTVNADYFLRDRKPYPITGTTYMAGDVSRKFLFEPNPAVWDRDFRAMKEAGVNMVRTGIWTGWDRVMLDPGAVDEGVLRAFSAFLLTARRYGIPVIFTFFAFLPPLWGGLHPFLDPRAVDAQKAFVTAFVSRFKIVKDLGWDLINEPAFCTPPEGWTVRPGSSRFEAEAWRQWLLARADEDEWRERWRLTPSEPLDLPTPEDFEDRQIHFGRRPLRALTYRLFAQEKFRDWAAEMVRAIHAAGGGHQLVTVGQDEGGTRDRPAPHFWGPAVDYTTNHSWWQNDDLLWDSVFTKLPDRPNLLEETGIMFVESPDGRCWRSPEEARNLLERKMALAFAGGCAGFIQWLWNTNIYMYNDNEAGIGFLRADGTEKPELEAFRGVARFVQQNAHRLVGRKPEQTVVIIPHSNLFSACNYADQATRRAVRALEYGLGLPVRCVSEYRMQDLGESKLIVLPSPRNLSEQCWQALLQKAESGATLLATGFLESDEYWRPVPRLRRLGLQTAAVPVRQHEPLRLPGVEHPLDHQGCDFRGEGIQRVDRAQVPDARQDVFSLDVGQGRLCWCAVPVELAESGTHVASVYQQMFAVAGVSARDLGCRAENTPGFLCRAVEFQDATLYVCVNESSVSCAPAGGEAKPAPAGRIAMAFVDNQTGEVVAQYQAS